MLASMRIYTRTGDAGETGLLYGGRARKDDARFEAVGAIDEAVATLGLARAALAPGPLRDLILRLQRELFVVGAECATSTEHAARLDAAKGTRVGPAMIEALEALIDDHVERTEMPQEFVIPGESPASAALDLARAIVRRAERRVVSLTHAGGLPDRAPQKYLNRLADLLFVLARHEEAGYTPLHER